VQNTTEKAVAKHDERNGRQNEQNNQGERITEVRKMKIKRMGRELGGMAARN
jgi:hypothetical protein